MTRYRSSIALDGPFFRNDPGKTFRQNARAMMEAVAKEGAKDVTGRMGNGRSRAPVSIGGGTVADRVVPLVAFNGQLGDVTAVVLVATKGLSRREAIAVRAAGSEVETQTHAFRQMTTRMRRARAINQAELLKGIQ